METLELEDGIHIHSHKQLAAVELGVVTTLDSDGFHSLDSTDLSVRNEYPNILVEGVDIAAGEGLAGGLH